MEIKMGCCILLWHHNTVQYINRLRIRILDLDFALELLRFLKDIKITWKLRLESGKKIGVIVKSLNCNSSDWIKGKNAASGVF